jgi:hypothetical protein
MLVKMIHEDCSQDLAQNKNLPSNSYIVDYMVEDQIKYDIVQSDSRVHIFDLYYDKYKNVRGMKWTSGIVSPRVWNCQPSESKKKKR